MIEARKYKNEAIEKVGYRVKVPVSFTPTEEQKTVTMTPEEATLFEAFKASTAKREAVERKKQAMADYRQLVDDEIDAAVPVLQSLSEDIKDTKKTVFENFRSIIAMKEEVLRVARDDQRTHTFTNSAGDKRITLGVYVADGYRDTVEDGIAIVKEYLVSLVEDERTKSLVNMVLRLLSRDVKGALKASRVVQLRKIAQDHGNERLMEGVTIIEDAYQPTITRQFVRAEVKTISSAWQLVPLGMTGA